MAHRADPFEHISFSATAGAITRRRDNPVLQTLSSLGLKCPFIHPHLLKTAPRKVRALTPTFSLLDSFILQDLASDTRPPKVFRGQRLKRKRVERMVLDLFPGAEFLGTGGARHAFKLKGETDAPPIEKRDGSLSFPDGNPLILKIAHTLCPINGWELAMYRYVAMTHGVGRVLATPFYLSSTVAVVEPLKTGRAAVLDLDKTELFEFAEFAERALDIQDVTSEKNGAVKIKYDNIGVRELLRVDGSKGREVALIDYAEPSMVLGYPGQKGLRTFESFMKIA